MADGRPQRPDREHPRVTVDAFVRIFGTDREFVFRTRDLSKGGLFLYTRVGHLYPFYVGAALHIELYDFDHAVEFRAVVVRIVESGSPESAQFPMGFGVRIVEIDGENCARLDQLIDRAKRGEPIY
jgi:hypothetical protein